MGFLKELFDRRGKARRLRNISRRVAVPSFDSGAPDPVQTMMARAGEREQALEELYDLCESDPEVNSVMQSYGATRETLKNLHTRLLAAGAGQWVGGHYVAASALAYPSTLDYLLRNNFQETVPHGPDVLAVDVSSEHPARAVVFRMTFRLIEYFERGEVGPVL